MNLKLLLTIASWMRKEISDYVALFGDVSQAFIHASMDEWVQTRIPASLDGLTLATADGHLELHTDMVMDIFKALYGYRKSPGFGRIG